MINFILGAGAVVVLLLIIGVNLSSKLGKYFFVENISKLNFEDSKRIIKENIEKSEEWVLRSEKDFNDVYTQEGQGNLLELIMRSPRFQFLCPRLLLLLSIKTEKSLFIEKTPV